MGPRPKLRMGSSVLLVIVLFGCGSESTKGPAKVVEQCYRGANEGDYETVEQCLSSEALDYFSPGPGVEFEFSTATGGGDMEKIEITKTDVKNGEARVQFVLHLKGGSRVEAVEKLVQ